MEFRDGILSQIFDKQSGEALFDTSLHAIGDVVALRSVGNGAGEFSTMQKPTTDHLESAAAINPRWELAETGPVYTLYRSVAPFENAEIVRTLRLYRNRKRIDFDTEIRNFDGTHYLEYRQLFPAQGFRACCLRRPLRAGACGHRRDAGSPGRTLYGRGPGDTPPDDFGWIAGESGGVAVGLATSAAAGRLCRSDPSRQPTDRAAADHARLAAQLPSPGRVLQPARNALFPLHPLVRGAGASDDARTPPRGGPDAPACRRCDPAVDGCGLAESGSFFTVGDGRAAFSTVKKAEEGDRIVLRLYNRSGEPVRVPFTAASGYDRIRHADLLERSSGEETPVIELAPYAIETYIIE